MYTVQHPHLTEGLIMSPCYANIMDKAVTCYVGSKDPLLDLNANE